MLSDREVSALCMERFRQADTYSTTIQNERREAIRYYNGEPFGDEKEGLSKFVTSDVRDTIEWMMPQLVEMFVGEDAFEFSAASAEDVEPARIEQAYVTHVYNEQNDGFLNTYTWIKDGLLLKNGVAKIYWDERVDEVEEVYEGKDIYGLQSLMNDEQVEIKEITASLDGAEYAFSDIPTEMQPAARYDVKCIRKSDNSKATIEVIPAENFFVAQGHNSLNVDSASFVCHRDTVTASDLIVDGYDKELVDSIPDGDESDLDDEKQARFGDEELIRATDTDRASREITVYECYVRADFDGNGKTELRMVKLAGPTGSIVLENEVVGSIPFAAWTPVISCHKFFGMSYADLVKDLQLLRSTLMRQMLNNLYLVNHPVKTVIETMVKKEDMLNTAPGAVWRVKQQDAVQTHVTPFVGDATMPVLSMVEEMRRERTGVSAASQGLDPSVLADSTNNIGAIIMTQAMQRIKMVARIFAETGYKSAILKIHELCSKHGKPGEFEYNGEWQQVDPRQWTKRTRFKVNVGVGHADKIMRLQGIGTVVQNLKEIAVSAGIDSPLASPENLYAAFVEQGKLLGYKDAEKFYRDPKTYQPPQAQPSEAIQITEATTVADLTKSRASNDIDLKKHNDDLALKKYEIDTRARLEQQAMEQDRDLKREEMLLRYGTQRGSNLGFEAKNSA